MNKVIIIGRLTRDPEIKLTQKQTKYASFTVAVDRKYKDAEGQKQTDFINCLAWKQTAEFINKYFHKGNRIGITGSIQTRNYEKDGQTIYITEVVVEDAEFVESLNKTESHQKNEQPEGNGSLPFEL